MAAASSHRGPGSGSAARVVVVVAGTELVEETQAALPLSRWSRYRREGNDRAPRPAVQTVGFARRILTVSTPNPDAIAASTTRGQNPRLSPHTDKRLPRPSEPIPLFPASGPWGGWGGGGGGVKPLLWVTLLLLHLRQTPNDIEISYCLAASHHQGSDRADHPTTIVDWDIAHESAGDSRRPLASGGQQPDPRSTVGARVLGHTGPRATTPRTLIARLGRQYCVVRLQEAECIYIYIYYIWKVCKSRYTL